MARSASRVKALLDRYQPDLSARRKGCTSSCEDIAADQPDYDWIGLGRDGGSRGEFMAIFYRRDRLEPLEYDHFWLSDTPEVSRRAPGATASDAWSPGCASGTASPDASFYFWNTHLDHEVPASTGESRRS